eukprot:TRINITY_DN11281_c0_g1_i9.p1 TRINITY_DN11281_c0_g1~~TRINITY_DN11281_c0_g1_i9.p1  ORF type:complete len:428 (-),score=43.81 TRINITY_DN11281_c0_g1_i9:138-1421(-)
MSLSKQILEVLEYYCLRAVENTRHTTCRDKASLRDKVKVDKILWRAKLHEALDADVEKNFMLKFESYQDLNYLLKENVSLYSFSKSGEEVSFVQVEEGEDVYSSKHGPFLYISQYNLATHIITLKTDVLLKFVESLEVPDTKIIFVANTGRCGSTLLAQMFENLSGLKVLSEPHSILNLLNMYNRKEITQERYHTLLRAAVKILASFQNDENLHSIVIKPVFKCTPQINFLSKAFPNSRTIFLYRNIKENVDSFMRVMVSFTRQSFLFTGESEMLEYWTNDIPLPDPVGKYRWALNPSLLKEMSLPGSIVLNWCSTVACIKAYIEQGIEILHMDYKVLVNSPKESWQRIADFTGLPNLEEKPLEAYNKDSQAGAFLSRGILAKAKIKKKDQAIIEQESIKFLAAFDLQRTVEEELNSVKGVLDREND